MKGYKVFNPDWTCRGFRFEVGKTYKENVEPSVCDKGFHFCLQAKDCFNYYFFDPENKVAEIVAAGEIAEEGDKCCTNEIEIVREIPWEELLTIVNAGLGNSGLCNSGNRNSGNGNSGDGNSGNGNSGDGNSGDGNSGNRNSGNWNSGDRNSGDGNSGNRNSGNRNSGNWNSGNGNSGDGNSGNRNSGNRNSGNWNSGNGNSGDGNSGNRNSGNWNLSNRNSGCFNTEQHKLLFFDKKTDWNYNDWRYSAAYDVMNKVNFRPTEWICGSGMTDAEKSSHPEYETTGGYLKKISNEDCYRDWWNDLCDYDRQKIKLIPNFDSDKFLKITGIDTRLDGDQ